MNASISTLVLLLLHLLVCLVLWLLIRCGILDIKGILFSGDSVGSHLGAFVRSDPAHQPGIIWR